MLVHPLIRTPLARHKRDATGAISSGDDVVVAFDGIPILLEDAAEWCARHRDSIVAAIATHAPDADLQAVIAAVDAVRAGAPKVQSATFVDDFTVEETTDAPPPLLLDEAIRDVVDDSTTPLSFLARHVPRAPVILEVGPGAGGLSAILASCASRRLYVMDTSLRAVLLGRQAARAAIIADRVTGVVGDACALPIADGTIDVVVAQNVIDIVDDADAFIAGVASALRPGGLFALTTPAPELDGYSVQDRLETAGFVIETQTDTLRWPRVHGPRHVELWTCVGLVARRR